MRPRKIFLERGFEDASMDKIAVAANEFCMASWISAASNSTTRTPSHVWQALRPEGTLVKGGAFAP